ncbi:MAG: hypothetical protein QY325_05585 [Flavobacteriales bacterium]|jgi:hypothetical protein|nr:MAG: hypothetical protein QY325_05585 [Flavobacteriales bacterium]
MRGIIPLVVLLLLPTPTVAQRVRTVHVLVALCDNQYQGIVKVPHGIGNGQKPGTNLYWGAGYGVRTHFDRSGEWKRVACPPALEPHILDRAVWKHRDSAVYLIAEAYDGQAIRLATEDLLRYASGTGERMIAAGGASLSAGGGADLLAYIGHDGLMDFALDASFPGRPGNHREAIILACLSQRFFAQHLKPTGAEPLLWTTGLMAPEAYTLKAALDGWVLRERPESIRERAAAAYHQYQRCGINGARRLFVTGW